MAFLIQRAAGRNFTLLRLDVDSLRIGRGTNQELRSENPAVSLEHAVISADTAGYVLHDRGSITGTYVNGNPVEAHRIAKGDAIGIGDLRLEVQMAEAGKPLFLRVTTSSAAAARTTGGIHDAPAPHAAEEGSGVVTAPVIDYAAAYRLRRPWLTKLTLTAILLIVAFTVIGEVILRPEGQELMMPGGVSSAHARAKDKAGNPIATRCDACHTPWKSVTSAKCASCHQMPPHAVHASAAPDCYACHAEHRGSPRLADIDASNCIACHADLGANVQTGAETEMFGDGRYSFEQIRRIAEFGTSHPEFAFPEDKSTLRFNHAVHLEGKRIFDARGKRETLTCASCHQLAEQNGSTDPAPIRFERHCQRCHLLTFDRRLPDVQVPHGGDSGMVYGFVVAAQRGDANLAGKSAVEARRILATQRPVTPDQRALTSAELVFKTRCSQCHALVVQNGRAAVVPPVTRTSWLSGSRFTHGPHRAAPCETCHAQARTSRATADVLMPQQKECSSCHGASATGTRSSSCLSCHEYHRPEQTS